MDPFMHPVGAFTGYWDVAQATLYAFWAFFAGLIFYLRREDKREGYPLVDDSILHSVDNTVVQGFPAVPTPKQFRTSHGTMHYAPERVPTIGIGSAVPAAPWPGAPLQPLGDPMLAAVGPGSYALRDDVDDETVGHQPLIVPMRTTPERFIDPKSPDPRGMTVRGANNRTAGVVRDLWIDRAEEMVRYLEVELTLADAPKRNVLVPMVMARIRPRTRTIMVKSILSMQFANIPATKKPDEITFAEEDRIVGYFGGGYLYATASRQGPVL